VKKGNAAIAELIPQPNEDQIVGSRTAQTYTSETLRKFGFLPDFKAWHPGDLILTGSSAPDWISEKIEEIQIGYGAERAKWTHAAIYLGDELMLCEAQLDLLGGVCEVRVTPVEDYVGTHSILVKRSRHASTASKGWAIATAAASKIGGRYDYGFVVRCASEWALKGESAFLEDKRGLASRNAFICSSLYSTAHCYVTDITIADQLNGLCLPAYLAATEHLKTVEFGWVKLA
jgi:hypothetical protein